MCFFGRRQSFGSFRSSSNIDHQCVGSEDDLASSGEENVVLAAPIDSEPTGATILLDLVDRLDPVRRKPVRNDTGTDPKYSNEEDIELTAPEDHNPAPPSPSGANPRNESPPRRESSILPAFGIAI
jgi:hypothetical protein